MSNLETNLDFDVIIIGGGAAGMSAALWCDELDLKNLLLEQNAELGGQMLRTYNSIKNHLGVEAKNGREMRDVFARQIIERRISLKLSARISEIDLVKKLVFTETGEKFSAGAIIIATGVRRRTLNVEGEKEFQNKGIIESGKRDQNFVKGKNAVIVGGGDAAFENALILAETASKVTLIHRSETFRARAEFIEAVKNNRKIRILTDTIVEKISGDSRVERVEVKHRKTDNVKILPADAVLIRIGVEPNTELFREKIDLDAQGYIKVNQNGETNIKGIFAVGDAANPLAPTISTAVGTGATAVKAITNFKLRITNDF